MLLPLERRISIDLQELGAKITIRSVEELILGCFLINPDQVDTMVVPLLCSPVQVG